MYRSLINKDDAARGLWVRGESQLALLLRALIPPSPFEPRLEQEFIEDYATRFATNRKTAVILGYLTWTGYSAIDRLQAYSNPTLTRPFSRIFSLREIGILLLIIPVILTFTPLFKRERFASLMLIAASLLTYSNLLVMTIIIPFPINYLVYFSGLPLVIEVVSGLFRVRSMQSLYLNIFFVLSGAFAFQYTDAGTVLGASSVLRVVNNYYAWSATSNLLSFAVIGYIIAVELERTARGSFLREHELKFVNSQLTRTYENLGSSTEALVAAKEELRQQAVKQNHEKSKFLSDAAHDLRNIMHGLSLNLEVAHIAAQHGDLQQCQDYVKLAKDVLVINTGSLNSILDISRLESGFICASVTEVDIADLVKEIASQFRWSAQEQKVSVRVRLPAKFPPVTNTDRNLLGRVLTNLVSNGIRYRDPAKGAGAWVFIGVGGSVSRPRIDVIDNGIGIAEEHWEDIFKPFTQLNNPERDRQNGHGLGLSIVNAIMPMLDGHAIEMKSAVGKGTRFSINLPPLGLQTEYRLGTKPSTLGTIDISGVFILYIEDDELIRKSTAALFDAHGLLYNIVPSVDGLRRQLKELERMPDVIVTDYRLPAGFNARDVVQLVRKEFDALIPAIVVTGEASNLEDELSAISPVRVLRKPVQSEAVLLEISRLCQH
jgi:signal transduction histidine kinase